MVRKVTALMMAAVVLLSLAAAVSATENGQMWLVVDAQDNTTVQLTVDTSVTDGVITVTYDPQVLTYAGIAVAEDQVAQYAVNSLTPGTLRIGWVGPGAEVPAEGTVLMTLRFTGAEQTDSLALAGAAHSTDGTVLALGPNQSVEKPAPTDPTEPVPSEGTQPTQAAPTEPQAPTEGTDDPSVDTGDRSMITAAALLGLTAMIGAALVLKKGWLR